MKKRLVPTESQTRLLPILAAVLCALYGLLLIVNLQPIGDGVWFWYAQALRSGQHLYRDLQIPVQPFFAFASEWNQRLLGNSWLASKVLAALQDALYCWGLYRVASQLPWRGWQKAILITAAYALTIFALYYRFDDFHITGHCLTIFSIDLCLRLRHDVDTSVILRRCGLLGLFSGIGLANRLNDGGLLMVASAAAIAVFARSKRAQSLAIFFTVTAVTMLALILLTGDTLRTWAFQTIFHAAAIKGGTGHMLHGPIHFPIQAIISLRPYAKAVALTYLAAILLTVTLFLYAKHRSRRAVWLPSLVATALVLLLVEIHPGTSLMAFTASLIPWLYAGSIVLVLRAALAFSRPGSSAWNRNEILLLFPAGQIFAGAMTSGESFQEIYPAIAMLWLVVPFIFPAITNSSVLRRAFLALLTLTSVDSLFAKTTLPYDWHHYHETSLFASREWYHHPQYGPMYIRDAQLHLVQQICGVVSKETNGSGTMLATPWPYANYFCSIPPWHGYVQSWYDTTSKQTMSQLVHDMQADPPEWIVYQRSLDTMAAHEKVFLRGGVLPHRALDQLIVQNVSSGAWTVRFQQCFDGADWIVVHTRAAKAGVPQELILPSADSVNLCARTNHGVLP